MPTVAADLGASSSAIALTVTTFLVGLALGQLLAGPLSDTYGRRRPLLVGLVVFTVASLVCALTPSAGVLVAVRLVQGLAGASGMAIANAVVTDYSRGRQAARLLSRLALVSGLAPIVAPLVGAQLLRVTSWRGLFVALTGLGVLLFSAVALGLRESLPRERRQAGGAARTLRTFGMLSRDLRFMGFASTSALSFVAFFAYLAASSFVYQDLYGASPVLFSLLFAANAIGMLAVSQLNHRLLARFSPRQLLGTGLVIGSLSGLAVLVVTLIGGLGIVGAGRAPVRPRRQPRLRLPGFHRPGVVAAPGRGGLRLRLLRHLPPGPRRPGHPAGRDRRRGERPADGDRHRRLERRRPRRVRRGGRPDAHADADPGHPGGGVGRHARRLRHGIGAAERGTLGQ